MATIDDLDAAEAPASPPRKPRNWKRRALVLLLGVALMGGAAMYLKGIGWNGEGPMGLAAKPQVVAPPLYLALDPPVVVNFDDQGELRFLQVSASIMTHDPNAIEAATYHMPRIRNALILLLGSQTYDSISTLAGKEKLRQVMLQDIQNVLKEAVGSPGIDAIYFTSLVMQ